MSTSTGCWVILGVLLCLPGHTIFDKLGYTRTVDGYFVALEPLWIIHVGFIGVCMVTKMEIVNRNHREIAEKTHVSFHTA